MQNRSLHCGSDWPRQCRQSQQQWRWTVNIHKCIMICGDGTYIKLRERRIARLALAYPDARICRIKLTARKVRQIFDVALMAISSQFLWLENLTEGDDLPPCTYWTANVDLDVWHIPAAQAPFTDGAHCARVKAKNKTLITTWTTMMDQTKYVWGRETRWMKNSKNTANETRPNIPLIVPKVMEYISKRITFSKLCSLKSCQSWRPRPQYMAMVDVAVFAASKICQQSTKELSSY